MNLQPVLVILEDAVQKELDQKLGPAIDAGLVKLANAIPGSFDDILIAQAAPILKKAVVEAIMAQADKIDGQVG